MYQTLNEALQQAAKSEHGIFFTNSLQDEQFLSYDGLWQGARRYLSLLRSHGVQPGDELVLQLDDLSPFLQLYWACLLGGIVPIPLAFVDVPDHAQKIASVWPVLRAPWLVTDRTDTFERLLKHADNFDPSGQAAEFFRQQVQPKLRVIADTEVASAELALPAEIGPDDIAFIQFSSGSTGQPKGVVLTHRNLLVNIEDMRLTFGLTGSDVFLTWKPKSHDFGMIAFHLTPLVAALPQVHIPTKTYVWSPAIWLQAVHKHRASILGSPNFGYQHLLKLYKRRRHERWDWDLSCIRTIVNGAEPISPQLCQAFCEEMAQYGMPAGAMRCAYGLAEASLMVSLCDFADGVRTLIADRTKLNLHDRFVPVEADHPAAITLVDCGVVFPSMQVRITDGTGQELPAGVVGCIEIRGGNVTAGYYRNPAATKKAVRPDGWVNTEDLGFIWQDRLVFASRLKEMIIQGGVNYFPYDIERAILQVVGDAALNQYIACAIPAPANASEQLAVFVYYKKQWQDFSPLAIQVRDIIRQHFALEVSYVVPVERIPKTTSGKVQRFRLRQQFLAGDFDEALAATAQPRQSGLQAVAAESASTSAGELLTTEQNIRQRIRALVLEQTGLSALDDQQSFFNLGLASSRLLQLQQQLEAEFAVEMAAVAVLDHASVDALTSCMLAARSAAPAAPATDSATAGLSAGQDIAIIGMACRFPGEAATPAAFWQLLCSGQDPVAPLPSHRWSQDPQKNLPHSGQEGAFLADISGFDPHFFGIAPKEAQAIDPQQRLLLEVCHEVIENAGFAVPALQGSDTAVFVGISSAEYAQVGRDLGHPTGPYASTGNMFNTAAGRISYVFGLEGPSIALDSACSSSLVGVHQAVQALRQGSCQQALVAAVNLILKPDGHLSYSQLNALSATGRCRSFDDAADGYIRSEGAAAVMLKPLAQAIQDGNPVLAVIRAVAVNHNGHHGGLTVPNSAAQQRVIRQALQQAGCDAEQIDYLEAHGSGTRLGDPQEAAALAAVFAGRQRPLLLGSVKSNLGHLEAAAGMAGLVKLVLALQHGQIPANLHLQKPNPLINWAESPLQLVRENTAWPAGNSRLGAITSLGINGSNAHLILQHWSAAAVSSEPDSAGITAEQAPFLFSWSAVSAASLQHNLQYLLQQLPQLEDIEFGRFCQASNLMRSAYPARFSTVVSSFAELRTKLARQLTKFQQQELSVLRAVPKFQASVQPVFLFTGQGAVYPAIAARLYPLKAVFRAAFDLCAQLFQQQLSINLHLALTEQAEQPLQQDPAFGQALTFSMAYALTALWRSLGIRPAAVLGHSIGEYAAAVTAGLLPLEMAVVLVSRRGQLMRNSQASGAMAAILATESQVAQWCAQVGNVWIAAVNSPTNMTIAGTPEALAAVIQLASRARVFTEVLPMQHAFHCPLVTEESQSLIAGLSPLMSGTRQCRFYSSVSGAELDAASATDLAYWQRQLVSPVQFSAALQQMVAAGARCFIEIGGTATLTALVAETCPETELLLVPSLRSGKDDWRHWQESMSQLYQAGLQLDWQQWHQSVPCQLPLLPNTQFARQPCWFEIREPAIEVQVPDAADRLAAPAKIVQSTVAMADTALAGQLAQQICQMLAEIAGFDEEELGPEVHLLSLGLDSLMLVQLGRGIQQRFQVEISLNDFFQCLYTPLRLASYLLEQMPVQPEAATAVADSDLTSAAAAQQPVAAVSTAQPPAAIPQLQLLIKQQLQVMEQQLQLLSSAGAGASVASGPLIASDVGSLQATSSVRSTQCVETVLPRIAPISWTPRSLNLQQQHFVDDLTTQITERTPSSKANASSHSQHLADWLLRAHYQPETAELGYLLVAERASGCRFTDLDGNEFIDTCLGFTSNLFGHNPDFIVEAISHQLHKGMILGPQSALAGEVAKLITELTGVERVAFTNSGTEAVMAALRVARAVTGRSKVVRFSTSYHGTFDGVLAQASAEGTAPMAIGVVPSMVDDTLVLKYGSEKSLLQIEQHRDDLAAILVEPVQSRNPALQPVAYLQKLRQLTADAGIALIFDEMVFGFRCHPGGIQQRFGIQADLVTYGKVVGGGMPIGVLAGSARWMNAIDGGDWLSSQRKAERPQVQTTFFAGTFCKHPLAMAAAHAVLTRLKQDDGALQRRLDHLTTAFAEQVNDFFLTEQVPLRINYFSSVYRYDLLPSVQPELLSLEADLFFKLLLQKGIYACYVWENRAGAFSTAHTPADIQQIVAAIKYATVTLRQGGFSFRTLSPDQPARNGSAADLLTRSHALSSEERRMFVLSHFPGAEQAYRINGGFKLSGALDLAKFRRALTMLVERHAALRTGYQWVSDRQTEQTTAQVRRDVSTDVVLPLRVLHPQAQAESTTMLPLQPAAEPLSITSAPLWRLTLSMDEQQQQHWLLLEFSHLIFDGISVSLLIEELFSLYAGDALPPSGADYSAYVAREQSFCTSSQSRQQLQFWVEQFADLPEPLQLPTDYPRPAQQDFRGAVSNFQFNTDTTALLRQRAGELRCTPFTLLFSCYLLLLHKLSGQQDLTVGVPVDQRGNSEFARTLGMFAQTLAIRTRLDSVEDVPALVATLATQCQLAYQHSQLPFEQLIDSLKPERDLSRNALFDTMFIYETGEQRSLQRADLQVVTVPVAVTASAFDLTLELTTERGQITGRLMYASSLFQASTAARFASQYQWIVQQVLAEPSQSLAQISLLTPAERQQLLSHFNQTQRDYHSLPTVPELFAAAAATHCQQLALVATDASLTYQQLNQAVQQLSAQLAQRGVGPADLVALLLPRQSGLIVAMLAVQQLGAAYVPLDPAYPTARVLQMLGQSQPKVLLTTAETLAAQPEIDSAWQASGSGQLLELGTLTAQLPDEHNDRANLVLGAARPELPAYCIFTSGSTGQPKGVLISQRSVVNFIHAMTEQLCWPAQARTLGLTSVSFDIFVLEVFVTLCQGGTLILASEQQQRDPALLRALLQEQRITVAQMTASRLELLLQGQQTTTALAGLSHLCIGGEAFPVQHLAALQQVPMLRIFNMYGPTETTVWSAVKELTQSTVVTLGQPIGNTQFYVLDSQQQLVAPGCSGELWIAGTGLAIGYLHDEARTAAVFLPNPFRQDGQVPTASSPHSARMYRTGDRVRWQENGELIMLGRVDHQIKLRGHRIEPAEIEVVLLQCPQVAQAVVVLQQDLAGQPALVAFATPSQAGSALNAAEFNRQLQAQLRQLLPEPMIPAAIVLQQTLPLTANSKVDRSRLPQWAELQSAQVCSLPSATDDTDLVLTNVRKLWRKLLGHAQLAADKSFFELGGNSMSLVMLHHELELHYPGLLDVADLFAHPTLQQLAQFISNRQQPQAADWTATALRLPADYFLSHPAQAGLYQVPLSWDSDVSRQLRHFSKSLQVTEADVLLAMQALLLHKLLAQQVLSLCLATVGGYQHIELNFTELSTTEQLVLSVHQLRQINAIRPACPRLGPQHPHGVFILWSEAAVTPVAGPAELATGFDLSWTMDTAAQAGWLIFNGSRLCPDKIRALASLYLRLVQTAVASEKSVAV